MKKVHFIILLVLLPIIFFVGFFSNNVYAKNALPLCNGAYVAPCDLGWFCYAETPYKHYCAPCPACNTGISYSPFNVCVACPDGYTCPLQTGPGICRQVRIHAEGRDSIPPYRHDSFAERRCNMHKACIICEDCG